MDAPHRLDLTQLGAYSLSASVQAVLHQAGQFADKEELPGSLGTGVLLWALYERGAEGNEHYAPVVLRRLIDSTSGPGLESCMPRFLEAERAKQYETQEPRALSKKLLETFADASILPNHDGILAARHLVVALLRFRSDGPTDPNSWRLLAQAGVDRAALLRQFLAGLVEDGPEEEREQWAKVARDLDLSLAASDASPTPARRKLSARPSLQMLSDGALLSAAEDRLGYQAYAQGLADVIGHRQLETPFTLAINAPWGAGKTSLANLLESELQSKRGPEPPHVICRFNAWLHDDAPKLGTAFAAAVARSAQRARPWYRRWLQPLPLGWGSSTRIRQYIWHGVALLLLAVFAALAFSGRVNQQVLTQVAGYISKDFATWADDSANAALAAKFGGVLAIGTVVVKLGGILMPAAGALTDFVKSPEKIAAEGALADIAAQLGKLIGQATRGRRRFIIFVDDLERCQPPRAVEVLEVINQLVAHREVVTVVLADMPAVTACAELKYKDLAERYAPNDGLAPAPARAEGSAPSSYGRLYIQKIIQLQFDLPPLDRARLRGLAVSLANVAPSPAAKTSWWSGVKRVTRVLSEGNQADELRDQFTTAVVVGASMTLAFFASNVGYGAVVAISAALINLGYGVLKRKRHERRIAELDQKIRVELDKGVQLSPERIGATVAQGADAKEQQLILERARLLVVDESEVRRQVEAVLADYIAPLPRYAKRAINRARFAIGVAFMRKLFEQDAMTVADRLGKWVCLLERWPTLAQALIRRPQTMTQLEDAAAHEDPGLLANLLVELSPLHAADSELRHLLCRAPFFAETFERLIRFEGESTHSGAN